MENFLEKLKEGSRRKIVIAEPHQSVFEDEKVSVIMGLCEKNGIDFDLMPICSPQLNPLNIYFRELKTKLKPLPNKTEDMIYFNLV